MLLAALVRLVGDGNEVVYLADRGRSLAVWEVSGADLQPRELLALPAPPVDRWRGIIGAGPTIGWSNVSDGPLDGLDGIHVGAGVYGRVGVTDLVALSAFFDPWAVASPIAEDQGGGTLFRAAVPVVVGVRFGPRTRKAAFEVGADVGLQTFGHFEVRGEPQDRLSFYADAAVGVSAAVSPGAGVRLQGWLGPGLGYLEGGASLSLEARL